MKVKGMTRPLGSLTLAVLVALTALVPLAWAQEGEIEREETRLETAARQPQYEARLKERYQLSDEQLNSMRDKGMSPSQITIAAQLAQSSGKSLDEVLQLRTEQKMGWGAIAKSLGVEPREIGKGVSSMRHELKEERQKMREEKRAEKREEKRQEREEKRKKRAEKREQRKAERAERQQRGGQ